jgi:predicted amidophosphoribosyltransferase
MLGLQELIGLLVCVTPPLIIVAVLVKASRRPRCPNCHNAVSPNDAACPKCGHSASPGNVASHTFGERIGGDE